MKTLQTLIPDIYSLFIKEGHVVAQDNLKELLEKISALCKEYLEEPQNLNQPPTLRLSKIGTKDRKLWYEFNRHDLLVPSSDNPDPMDYGPNFMRFFAGHLWEAVLIFLAKEAGHKVERAQEEVYVDDVPGHLDAFIDDDLVDIKTASHWGAQKFSLESMQEEDSFGYIDQISAYREASGAAKNKPVYFWVFNKSNCSMALLEIPTKDLTNATDRVKHVKNIISAPKPPKEKCWPEQPWGKSGNKGLHKACNWCPFKDECWKDANGGKGLRKFKYASGIQYLTHVVKTPEVEEV